MCILPNAVKYSLCDHQFVQQVYIHEALWQKFVEKKMTIPRHGLFEELISISESVPPVTPDRKIFEYLPIVTFSHSIETFSPIITDSCILRI